MKRKLLLIQLFFLSSLVHAEQGEFISERPTYDHTIALEHLASITSSLDSYREMTEIVDSQLKEKVDNTSWEMQNIGFPNWTNYIKGTLLKQNLRIAELEREQASTPEEIRKRQNNLQQARKEYEDFTQRLQVVD
ncbi:TPA: chromosome partitioning protein ParA [Vibrio vulnificus]|uniref:chromosome partitioning protein ParA n=1 Tax=Vibrio vulnificus TaxID=672 RepID=UPI000D3E142B|nr:chromosome partitioning protein ParA [Vibrio vulnificus]PUZ87632.1 chromosome partitioning protein ParA [Vibrio vulnificus]HAS6395474.1 chromosome partitioning protein ParA [Vibrio vulnificus]HDY7509328.1 chromosome partitioning protein ParA [Vibrio vulnificus]HDY7921788.1 chromosome partitioning protein ParA [Vibrio vulnificus]HDY8009967.1 chromosome partitioning protein ParA [Vibrio vulnificus]